MELGKLEYLISVNNGQLTAGLNKAEKTVEAAGSKMNSSMQSMGNKMSSFMVAKGQLIANALQKAFSTTVDMTKQLVKSAISAYADFEQLEGGISKLYGDAAGKMMDYARQAYATAGMSANEYIQNVTGFSAALLKSVGDDANAAADIADMAMRDISDNANMFGKYTASELAGVYQALARGQYQTLDNLQLGYGGKKKGLQELIDHANELRKAEGKNADLSIENYADIVQAIHAVQEELKITGTTEKEASNTITGSINKMKAAWQNLLVSFSDPNGDVEGNISKLFESLKTVAKNLVPVFKKTLKSIWNGIKSAVKRLPDLISDVFGDMKQSNSPFMRTIAIIFENVAGYAKMVIDLINDFPGTIEKLRKADSPALNAIAEILNTIGTAAQDAIKLIEQLTGMFSSEGTTEESFLSQLFSTISEYYADIGKAVETIGKFFSETLPGIMQKLHLSGNGTNPLISFLQGMITPLRVIAKLISGDFSGAIDLMANVNWFQAPAMNVAGKALGMGKAIFDSLGKAFSGDMEGALEDIQTGFDTYIRQPIQSVIDSVKEIIGGIWTFIEENIFNPIKTAYATYLETPITDAIKKIEEIINGLGETIKGIFESVGEWIKSGIIGPIRATIRDLIGLANQSLGTNINLGSGFYRDNAIWNWGMATPEQRTSDEFIQNMSKDLTDMGYSAEQIASIIEQIRANAEMTKEEFAKVLDGVEIKPDVSSESLKDAISKIRSAFNNTVFKVNVYPDVHGKYTGYQQAKGDWTVPYDNYPSLLHRGEMVLTASQARKYRDGEDSNYVGMSQIVATAVNAAMSKVYVMLNGDKVGDLTSKRVNRNINASSYSRLRAMGG